MDERWLSVGEVATIANVSRETVTREIKRGHLEAVRFGKQYRIPREALKAYMAERGCVAHG